VNTAAPSAERAERYPSSVALHRRPVRSTIEAAAISELARRTLRSKGVVIRHHNPAALDIDNLSVKITDLAPGVLLGVVGEISNSKGIVIDIMNSPGGVLSNEEPGDHRVVWIPGDCTSIWNRFTDTVLRLAAAGYPGCVGCAGPAAEVPWDEEVSRQRLR
ncbi:uncharacterized protein METZ01_LOCUS144222, partial [marine metagenome]